jgi:hypothetical protein
LMWIGWPGASSNSATPLNRVYVTGTVVALAVLPWVVRRHFGPVRGGWAPRAARVGGYAMVLALIAAKAVKDRYGSKLGAYFVIVPEFWVLEIVLLLVIVGYVAGLLILTSQHVRLTRWGLPVGIGFGAATAGVLYALAPFGVNVDPNSPEKALRNLLDRDRMFTGLLRAETNRLELTAIKIDTTMTEDDLTERVTEAFEL